MLTHHQVFDILYYLAFAGGQSLFMLKRADLAVRSPLNAVHSKQDYFKSNWVPLLIRSFIEFVIVFMPYRHFDTDKIVSAIGWNIPFHIPQNWVVSAFLGYLSDSIMDWVVMQDKIAGITVPKLIKETIPQLLVVQNIVATIKRNGKTEIHAEETIVDSVKN